MKLQYNRHYFQFVQGHFYIETAPERTFCTIQLTPAASATQGELDEAAEEIVKRVNLHDDLVYALGGLLEYIPCPPKGEAGYDDYCRAFQALAEARAT